MDKTLEARWVVHSETGRKYLITLDGKILCDENFKEVDLRVINP